MKKTIKAETHIFEIADLKDFKKGMKVCVSYGIATDWVYLVPRENQKLQLVKSLNEKRLRDFAEKKGWEIVLW